MKDLPVQSVSPERSEDTVPDVLNDSEVDIKCVGYSSLEAASIRNL